MKTSRPEGRARRRRLWRVVPIVIVAAGLGTGGVAGAHSTARQQTVRATGIGPFTGVATGLVDRFRHRDNRQSGTQHVESLSKNVYKARLTFSFSVAPNGVVVGRGHGVYTSATWNLSGTNGDRGPFNCDVPVTDGPFQVNVSGRSSGGVLSLRFALDGASEHNNDYDCGAGFTGFATDSTYLADSPSLVIADRGGHLRTSQARPSIPKLSEVVQLGDDTDRQVNLHEWTFTIKDPPGPGGDENDPGPALGGVSNPASPLADACTITGTPGNDVLTGTSGQDVICGFGGDDRISARAGNDIVFGGPGRDRIAGGPGHDILRGNRGKDLLLAKDGERDRVDGGPGPDTGSVDPGRDRVVSVEVLA